jgi:hypothetical protein
MGRDTEEYFPQLAAPLDRWVKTLIALDVQPKAVL